ncbi:hypothetical protein HDV05_001985 [Chytridiales sp. JEL 0842]|nr:hypothetical protein HDV05_001985 [Chytridiales sp. JEL 0842]
MSVASLATSNTKAAAAAAPHDTLPLPTLPQLPLLPQLPTTAPADTTTNTTTNTSTDTPTTTQSSAFTAIPTIDLAKPKHVVAQDFHAACANVGFLQVINHGVTVPPLSLLEFFHLATDDQKKRLGRGQKREDSDNHLQQEDTTTTTTTASSSSSDKKGYYRGYFPLVDSATSYKEGFEIGSVELSDAHKLGSHPSVLHEPNRWPLGPQFEHWKTAMKAYYTQVQNLGCRLMSCAAISLGLDENYFEPFFVDQTTGMSLSTLRIIRYPSPPIQHTLPQQQQQQKVPLSCSEHTDSGILTILYQDSTGGLEVQNSLGTWVPVPPNPNALVINIGDLLSMWSGYRWKSTMHRVRQVEQGRTRYSIPFFLEPRYDAVIEPLAIDINDKKDGERGDVIVGGGEERTGKHESRSIVYGPWLLKKITTEFVEYKDLLTAANY